MKQEQLGEYIKSCAEDAKECRITSDETLLAIRKMSNDSNSIEDQLQEYKKVLQ